MKKSEALFGLLRVASDAAAVFASLAGAYWLRSRNIDLIPGVQILKVTESLPPTDYFLSVFVLPWTILFLAVAALLKLYLIRITLSRWSELGRIVVGTIVWLALILSWFVLVRKQLLFSRALLLHATVLVLVFVTSGRAILFAAEHILLRFGIGVRNILALGRTPLLQRVEETLQRDPRYRYLGQVQSLHGLHERRRRWGIDLVLQTDPGTGSVETNELINFCRSHQIGYAFLPPVLMNVPHLLSLQRLEWIPLIRFHPTPLDGWGAIVKRILDLTLTLILLPLLLPLFLIITIAIKIDTEGPVFFVSRRVGKGGRKIIPILKFRSMVKDAEELKPQFETLSHRQGGPLFKVRNDPRVTVVGRVLRRFSLDELPQFFNVLLGHLSLVGPRPHLMEEVMKYSDFERRVFAVQPGLTGISQISGRSDLGFDDEVRLDLQYIEEWSIILDISILLKTIWVVLLGRGAD
jgi:exopolysaccharide biosynthesis polyprenyl glycosylphosphotransferase